MLPTDLPRLDELEAMRDAACTISGYSTDAEFVAAVRLSRALADALWEAATADRYADEVPALGNAIRLLEAIKYAPKPKAASPASKEEGNG